MPVSVVEEPEFVRPPGTGPALRAARHDAVTVLTPELEQEPAPPGGFNERTNPVVRALLDPFLAEVGLTANSAAHSVVWYYTPMALGAEPAALGDALVVFDAMDELAQFHGAPPKLRAQEAALMDRADLVFAGGPSLYEARRHRHPAVHCFPSGVEAAHFARAADSSTEVPAALATAPRPILGFYGVIDERLDLDLLAAVADARPDWTLALVGPVVKIDPATLPQRPNIAYLGQQAYADLPAFLAAFDVALMPFARNEATRFISPTKTLEYLAGEKPIVSTPIADVVSLYGAVVAVAESPAAFVSAVDAALTETQADRDRRLAAARLLLAEHDWDAIAARMLGLIETTIGSRVVAADGG